MIREVFDDIVFTLNAQKVFGVYLIFIIIIFMTHFRLLMMLILIHCKSIHDTGIRPGIPRALRSLAAPVGNGKPITNIVGYAHERGMKTAAEGIETANELTTVLHLGVDPRQGIIWYAPRQSPRLSIIPLGN